MAPCALGPCEIVIEPLREGRGTSFATASLFQNDELKVRATAAYTDLEQLVGETWVNSEMPEAPPFESLADQRANLLKFISGLTAA